MKNQLIKSTYTWIILTIIVLSLIRIPLLKLNFLEGDCINITAGIQAWVRGGSFLDVPLYRYNFQFGSYWMIGLWSIIVNLFGSWNVLASFNILNFLAGGVFCSFIAGWFITQSKYSPVFILPVALAVMMVPEIMISMDFYPNTSMLSLMWAAVGYFTLAKIQNFKARISVSALMFALSMACRIDALELIPLAVAIIITGKYNSKMKNISGFIGLTALLWITAAVVSGISFYELFESIGHHVGKYHPSWQDRIKMFQSGISPNILIALLISVIYINRTKQLIRTTCLLLVLGLPSLINVIYLTTPKYLLPFYLCLTLICMQGFVSLVTDKRWFNKIIGIILFCIYSLHLFVGQALSSNANKELMIGKMPIVWDMFAHDGPRPQGSLYRFIWHYEDTSFRVVRDVMDTALLYAEHNLNVCLYIPDNWYFWGYQRFILAQEANSYSRWGQNPSWSRFPVAEVFLVKNGSITSFAEMGKSISDKVNQEMDSFDCMICYEEFMRNEFMARNWVKIQTIDRIQVYVDSDLVKHDRETEN